MMNSKYIRMSMLALVGMLFWKCESDDPNIKNTAAKDMAGEWYVTYTVDGDDINHGHTPIIVTNTAANIATEIMISDYNVPGANFGNFWSFRAKAQADPVTKEFSATQALSSVTVLGDPYETKVNIMNGKIFPKGGFSRTGVAVDSIYFEIQFEDDAPSYGTTYVVSGHKRTGFAADDY